jgi:hypothetical protein
MILSALAGLYERLKSCDDIRAADEGYQWQDIDAVIVLDADGDMIGLHAFAKDKVEPRLVPRYRHRSGRDAWKTAQLLWDNPEYALGIAPKGKNVDLRKPLSFINLLSLA